MLKKILLLFPLIFAGIIVVAQTTDSVTIKKISDEILSNGNPNTDLKIKFDLYEENAVQEYWIVNPSEKTILIYSLQNDKYIGSRPFTTDTEIQSVTFPDLKFEVNKIF